MPSWTYLINPTGKSNVISAKNFTGRIVGIAILTAGFAVMNTGTSFAHSGTEDEQQACTPDVFRLCSAQIPNEDRIVACLNGHMAKLSPACRAVMRGEKTKPREKR